MHKLKLRTPRGGGPRRLSKKNGGEWRRGLLAVVFQNHAASPADSFPLGLQTLQNAEIVRDVVFAVAVRVRGAGGLFFRCTNKDKASRKDYRCVALSKNRRGTECQEQRNNTYGTT
jgi:hypothetical protein